MQWHMATYLPIPFVLLLVCVFGSHRRFVGSGFFFFSFYRYGESQGIPSEAGLYLDSEAALQWLRNRADIDPTRLVLFGRSLGGGVAIDLASKHVDDGAVRAIIVENTFSSISSMVDCIFPYLSVAKPLLLRMKWDSKEKIATITRPILFISGAQVRCIFFFSFASFFLLAFFLSPFLLPSFRPTRILTMFSDQPT